MLAESGLFRLKKLLAWTPPRPTPWGGVPSASSTAVPPGQQRHGFDVARFVKREGHLFAFDPATFSVRLLRAGPSFTAPLGALLRAFVHP